MSTNPQILVIDDENSIADMVAEALRDEGYIIHTAYDGRRGLELARHHRPDLILTDVMMPYMDGLEMVEVLQKDLGSQMPPVIFMSAVDCRNQTQEYGSFLFKPFTLDSLFNVVMTILA